MEGDGRKIGTDRLTGPDTGKVTGRRKSALTSHRTSQGRQRKPRKENATPAEANPGQAIAQNRLEAMQVCLGLTAMSAPFAFGVASPAMGIASSFNHDSPLSGLFTPKAD